MERRDFLRRLGGAVAALPLAGSYLISEPRMLAGQKPEPLLLPVRDLVMPEGEIVLATSLPVCATAKLDGYIRQYEIVREPLDITQPWDTQRVYVPGSMHVSLDFEGAWSQVNYIDARQLEGMMDRKVRMHLEVLE